MILKKFTVNGLHDLIDADIDFHDDMNIIVGRNGSGKTSILSLLSSIVRMDIETIKSMVFNYCELTVDAGSSGTIKISASNMPERHFIAISWPSHDDIEIPLDMDVLFRYGVRRATPAMLAATLGVNTVTNPAELFRKWSSISTEFLQLAKLTFVRLDRTIVAMDPDGIEAAENGSHNSRERSRSTSGKRDPIDEVIRVTQAKYFEYKRSVDLIRAEVYRELMRLHFSPVKPLGKKGNITQLKKKLAELKLRVNSSSLVSDIQELTKEFFESLESLVKQAEPPSTPKRTGRRTLAEESVQLMLELKESQTEELLNIFDSERKKMFEANKSIRNYLDTLEKFLSESGKRLWFSEESLQLAFYIESAGEKAEGVGRNLKDLSSGERQILIVLTYLAFLSGPDSIFIIDEPELSLHLRWQGYLIEALQKLRPPGSQILIATHSPEIAGRARRRSIQLSQRYLPKISESKDV